MPSAPIVLGNYQGERAIIDQAGSNGTGLVLPPSSTFVWVWGLEFTNSDPTRITTVEGVRPPIARGDGQTLIGTYGSNYKVINCIFHDAYDQLILRKRVPIVSTKMGGLKPGETKSFRLAFDEIPDSWLVRALAFLDPDTGFAPPGRTKDSHLRWKDLARSLGAARPGFRSARLPRRNSENSA